MQISSILTKGHNMGHLSSYSHSLSQIQLKFKYFYNFLKHRSAKNCEWIFCFLLRRWRGSGWFKVEEIPKFEKGETGGAEETTGRKTETGPQLRR